MYNSSLATTVTAHPMQQVNDTFEPATPISLLHSTVHNVLAYNHIIIICRACFQAKLLYFNV